jgi:hypothetical protein
MKTMEQWDVDITQQNIVISSGMDKFGANIQNLGMVMGKDPTVIYDILKKNWDAINLEYQGLVYRNVTTLEYISKRLDKIIAVLAEVMANIDDMEKARSDGGDLTNVALQIGQGFDKIASDIEGYLAEQVDVDVPRDWIKAAMIGVGSYLVLRYVGLDKVWSIAAAAALAYWMSTPKTVSGADIEAQLTGTPAETPALPMPTDIVSTDIPAADTSSVPLEPSDQTYDQQLPEAPSLAEQIANNPYPEPIA